MEKTNVRDRLKGLEIGSRYPTSKAIIIESPIPMEGFNLA